MKKLLIISNTGTKNIVGLVQCFQAEARKKTYFFRKRTNQCGINS